MAVRDGDRDRERSPAHREPDCEQTCSAWASHLVAPVWVGDAPRVLLNEIDGIEVWGLVEPWTVEQLVDEMDSRPPAPVAGDGADA